MRKGEQIEDEGGSRDEERRRWNEREMRKQGSWMKRVGRLKEKRGRKRAEKEGEGREGKFERIAVYVQCSVEGSICETPQTRGNKLVACNSEQPLSKHQI